MNNFLQKIDIPVNKYAQMGSNKVTMDFAKNLKFIFRSKNHVALILRVLKAFASQSVPEDGKKKEFGVKNKRSKSLKDFITRNS